MAKKKSAAKPRPSVDETEGLTAFELRDLLRRKLAREGREDLAFILEGCADILELPCVCCGKTLVVERGCKKRWCPVCAPRVTAARIMRVESIVARFQWPLAVTLTRTNVLAPEDCIESFKKAFAGFRETVFWERNVKGGVVGFEVTHRGNGFHPHLHTLVDCEWLAVTTPKPRRGMSKKQVESLCSRAQEELSEVWGAYVQGSKATVWANRAYGNSLMETLKYSVKPGDLLRKTCRAGDLIDMIDAGRTMQTFGHAHASSRSFVGREDPPEQLKPCDGCGGFKTLLPKEIRDMSLDRPELATRRFHKLMSLATALYDDNKTWDPLLTVPDVVTKGRTPNPIRIEADAAKAAAKKAQEIEDERRAAIRAAKIAAAEAELARQKAERRGGREWTQKKP